MSEAIKYYEAALKEAFPTGASGSVFDHWNKARQVAALDAMADNERELGLGFHEQEPKREWFTLEPKDMPGGEDLMYDHPFFIAGMVWAANKLKEKNT